MAHLIGKEDTINWLNKKGLAISANSVSKLSIFTEMGHTAYINVGELEDVVDLTIVRNLLSEVTSLIITEYKK